ncbi:serine/threonine protein kinase [Streptomyces triculaminicus]|uniref:Serine/threonine protein kinase n=2 Tax=Streptomyces TaxID=1883 RepID=A0A939FP45_9ACTN|nr:serine/threonine protein kinase [Streptomyces triculaminicus]QSY48929.1 serine/threonine protein kinase [Streptomyces griseocarneus]
MVELPVGDPRWVGRYRIVGRLGSGGMGWVYLARSPGGRLMAVKVVRPELAADRTFRKRFAREVEAARAVGGAFTASVVDADAEADPPWLATVYVPGPSLTEAVRADGPLPEEQVWQLGAGLVEALQAIHGAHVVHRDLKPSNVLLAEDGPRVIDFGISLVEGRNGLTLPGVVMGTPPFMSPEQVMGERVGPPSDVFSLGGVLVFAATGRAPFGHGEGLFYRVAHQEPRLDAVPAGLRSLVARCMAKPPGARPTTEALLEEFAARSAEVAEECWPPPGVAETIRERAGEVEARGSTGTPGASVPSRLLSHAEALLDAGLTDGMVVEASWRR